MKTTNYKLRIKNRLEKIEEALEVCLKLSNKNYGEEDRVNSHTVEVLQESINSWECQIQDLAFNVSITDFYKVCNVVDPTGDLAKKWSNRGIIDYCQPEDD